MIRFFAKKVLPAEQRASAVESLIVLVLIGIGLVMLTTQVTGWRARHRDNQRRDDIAALQQKVTEYYALRGYYPAHMTDIKGLSAPDYTYRAFAAGTQPSTEQSTNCDNKKQSCVSYIIFTNAMERVSNPYSVRSY